MPNSNNDGFGCCDFFILDLWATDCVNITISASPIVACIKNTPCAKLISIFKYYK